MGIEASLASALGPLASGRAYPDTFPQDYAWPAIRYSVISALPDATACGNGGDNETDYRVQIDAVARTDTARDALRIAVVEAMRTFVPPAICLSWGKEYDSETKAYRARLDYLIHPSSLPET